jgi:hypothetical protein
MGCGFQTSGAPEGTRTPASGSGGLRDIHFTTGALPDYYNTHQERRAIGQGGCHAKGASVVHVRYGAFVDKVAVWARQDANVDGVMMVGSQTRHDLAADEWSGLDLLMAAHDPEPLFQHDNWLRQFGDVQLLFNDGTKCPASPSGACLTTTALRGSTWMSPPLRPRRYRRSPPPRRRCSSAATALCLTTSLRALLSLPPSPWRRQSMSPPSTMPLRPLQRRVGRQRNFGAANASSPSSPLTAISSDSFSPTGWVKGVHAQGLPHLVNPAYFYSIRFAPRHALTFPERLAVKSLVPARI